MRLEEYMRDHKVDDDALGALIDKDRTSVSKFRRGLIRPSWDTAARIKRATGGLVTADDFLPELPEEAEGEPARC